MPFPFWPIIKIFRKTAKRPQEPSAPDPAPPTDSQDGGENRGSEAGNEVRRHFYNERGFQTYGSFFEHWGGWITAGHVLSEANGLIPDFANGEVIHSPAGLDGALIGCQIPDREPEDPRPGQNIYCIGYPAGSAHPARRDGRVYLQRPGQADTWIAHILTPDEPVVTGMSGGAVFDKRTHAPIGIIITRNSPADLNNDRDPDESFDFVSLAGVWRAIKEESFV